MVWCRGLRDPREALIERSWGPIMRIQCCVALAHVAACWSIVSLCGLVRAQESIAADTYLNQQIISVEDVETLTELAQLSDDQVQAARELLRGARSDLAVSKRRFERAEQEIDDFFTDYEDPVVKKKASDQYTTAWKRYLEDSQKAEKQFMTDLKSLLDETQAESWTRYERSRRRLLLKYCDNGVRVDLVEELRGMKLTSEERAMIKDSVERYESELDKLIGERRAMTKELGEFQPREWYMEDRPDKPQVRERMEELDKRIAAHQQQFSRMIAASLQGQRGDELVARYNRVTQRGWFRPLDDWERIRTLTKLRGISDEQRDRISALAKKSDEEMIKLIRPYVQALREREEGRGPKDDKYEEIQTQAWKDYAKVRAKLWKDSLDVLTPEQRAGYQDGTDPADERPERDIMEQRRRRW